MDDECGADGAPPPAAPAPAAPAPTQLEGAFLLLEASRTQPPVLRPHRYMASAMPDLSPLYPFGLPGAIFSTAGAICRDAVVVLDWFSAEHVGVPFDSLADAASRVIDYLSENEAQLDESVVRPLARAMTSTVFRGPSRDKAASLVHYLLVQFPQGTSMATGVTSDVVDIFVEALEKADAVTSPYFGLRALRPPPTPDAPRVFAGLLNKSLTTCYLNSAIASLYAIPHVRDALLCGLAPGGAAANSRIATELSRVVGHLALATMVAPVEGISKLTVDTEPLLDALAEETTRRQADGFVGSVWGAGEFGVREQNDPNAVLPVVSDLFNAVISPTPIIERRWCNFDECPSHVSGPACKDKSTVEWDFSVIAPAVARPGVAPPLPVFVSRGGVLNEAMLEPDRSEVMCAASEGGCGAGLGFKARYLAPSRATAPTLIPIKIQRLGQDMGGGTPQLRGVVTFEDAFSLEAVDGDRVDYDLRAVIVHKATSLGAGIGLKESNHSGHYIAYVRPRQDDEAFPHDVVKRMRVLGGGSAGGGSAPGGAPPPAAQSTSAMSPPPSMPDMPPPPPATHQFWLKYDDLASNNVVRVDATPAYRARYWFGDTADRGATDSLAATILFYERRNASARSIDVANSVIRNLGSAVQASQKAGIVLHEAGACDVADLLLTRAAASNDEASDAAAEMAVRLIAPIVLRTEERNGGVKPTQLRRAFLEKLSQSSTLRLATAKWLAKERNFTLAHEVESIRPILVSKILTGTGGSCADRDHEAVRSIVTSLIARMRAVTGTALVKDLAAVVRVAKASPLASSELIKGGALSLASFYFFRASCRAGAAWVSSATGGGMKPDMVKIHCALFRQSGFSGAVVPDVALATENERLVARGEATALLRDVIIPLVLSTRVRDLHVSQTEDRLPRVHSLSTPPSPHSPASTCAGDSQRTCPCTSTDELGLSVHAARALILHADVLAVITNNEKLDLALRVAFLSHIAFANPNLSRRVGRVLARLPQEVTDYAKGDAAATAASLPAFSAAHARLQLICVVLGPLRDEGDRPVDDGCAIHRLDGFFFSVDWAQPKGIEVTKASFQPPDDPSARWFTRLFPTDAPVTVSEHGVIPLLLRHARHAFAQRGIDWDSCEPKGPGRILTPQQFFVLGYLVLAPLVVMRAHASAVEWAVCRESLRSATFQSGGPCAANLYQATMSRLAPVLQATRILRATDISAAFVDVGMRLYASETARLLAPCEKPAVETDRTCALFPLAAPSAWNQAASFVLGSTQNRFVCGEIKDLSGGACAVSQKQLLGAFTPPNVQFESVAVSGLELMYTFKQVGEEAVTIRPFDYEATEATSQRVFEARVYLCRILSEKRQMSTHAPVCISREDVTRLADVVVAVTRGLATELSLLDRVQLTWWWMMWRMCPPKIFDSPRVVISNKESPMESLLSFASSALDAQKTAAAEFVKFFISRGKDQIALSFDGFVPSLGITGHSSIDASIQAFDSAVMEEQLRRLDKEGDDDDFDGAHDYDATLRNLAACVNAGTVSRDQVFSLFATLSTGKTDFCATRLLRHGTSYYIELRVTEASCVLKFSVALEELHTVLRNLITLGLMTGDSIFEALQEVGVLELSRKE